MTEIERIQELLKEYNYDSDGIGVVAKAIEQYVIKVRIYELSRIRIYDNKRMNEISKEGIDERIAELKKGLE